MLQYILYFLIVLAATTAGSATGIGGGVIIKPLLDALHDYDVETICVLSSITILAMCIVSIGKHIAQKSRIDFKTALPLAIGAVIGGLAGQVLLEYMVSEAESYNTVTVIQNIIQAVLITGVFLYVKNKNKLKSFGIKGFLPSTLAGIFLGVVSACLGIGGGPINVALLILLFSYDIKTATICSIIIILFAQMSKLLSIAFTTGFSAFDLSMLPIMITAAVAGGFIGAVINKKLSEKTIEKFFSVVQIAVLAITLYNILKNL